MTDSQKKNKSISKIQGGQIRFLRSLNVYKRLDDIVNEYVQK
jgi:hypothetical protein